MTFLKKHWPFRRRVSPEPVEPVSDDRPWYELVREDLRAGKVKGFFIYAGDSDHPIDFMKKTDARDNI